MTKNHFHIDNLECFENSTFRNFDENCQKKNQALVFVH